MSALAARCREIFVVDFPRPRETRSSVGGFAFKMLWDFCFKYVRGPGVIAEAGMLHTDRLRRRALGGGNEGIDLIALMEYSLLARSVLVFVLVLLAVAVPYPKIYQIVNQDQCFKKH